MGKGKTVTRTASGLFVRNLGWKPTTGGYTQHKFHLGRDEAKATLAGLRLEHLWKEVVTRWEREAREAPQGEPLMGNVFALGPNGFVRADAAGGSATRPVWDAVTLQIAEAVRKGEPVAKVTLPSPLSALKPESPLVGEWLDRLQADFTVVKVELADPEVEKVADEAIQKQGQRLVDMGRRMLRRKAGGETLHAALSAYARWIEGKYLDAERRVTAWGGLQGRQVDFLKAVLPNTPLSALDVRGVDELLEVLRLRPAGKEGTAVSVSWTRNVIKQFRHFLRWLSRSDEFAWKRPADLEFGQVRIPLSPGEKGRAARATQVSTYTPEELKKLWEYAIPFERLLMLLALNCGFGRAEVASLDTGEVLLHRPHPRPREVGLDPAEAGNWVLRIRHKSGVYGEWKLWPETVRAVGWWLKQRAAVRVPAKVSTLLVTSTGQRFDTPTKGNHPNYQIPNAWLRLTDRVRKDFPDFRVLSFNKLRKTAGNLVREKADGEVAGVFLAHGQPVRSDSQLDVYTNRPFAKVFAALERVGDELRPLWAGVPEPFPDDPPKKGGPNISLGTIRRIQRLAAQGKRVGEIAELVGVSRATVTRWAKNAPPTDANG